MFISDSVVEAANAATPKPGSVVTDEGAATVVLGPGPGGQAAEPEASAGYGRQIGRYLVLGTLGAGAMGVVHAAYDPELDRKVALKLVRRGSKGSAGQTRLLREAQALARLNHPNVVSVHDVGTVDGQVWIVMELVNGVTLRQWARAERRSWREVVALIKEAAMGLEAAHAADVLHRDFKPEFIREAPGCQESRAASGLVALGRSSRLPARFSRAHEHAGLTKLRGTVAERCRRRHVGDAAAAAVTAITAIGAATMATVGKR